MSLADRAQETTNTTGTGTLTLAGAVTGYQSFTSAFATGTAVDYVIYSNNTDWEVGRGTFTTSGTTLTRTTILRSSNSNNAISVTAGAKVWADIGADNFTGSVQKFRNRIYNGQFRFDQINESVVFSCPATSSTATLDGWTGSATGTGTYTVQRVPDPDNATLAAMKFTVTVADVAMAATDNYYLYTAIEGYDVADLKAGTANAQQITISFDMKFSVTGTYCLALHNTGFARSYVGTVTQNVSNATESKTLTLTLDTTGTWDFSSSAGIYLSFCLACGSNFQTTAGSWQAGNFESTSAQANFMSSTSNIGYIKRLQLEKGNIATPFEEISYQQELARLERHYQKARPDPIYRAKLAAATNFEWISFRTVMRATPTMSVGTPVYGGSASGASLANVASDGAELLYSSVSVGDYVFLPWIANARMS